jgi:hypothetical protein
LKAILLDDALHATGTDEEAGLAELLGDDIDRGIGIEEAVTDDLAFDFVGPDRVAFGATFVRLEGDGPSFVELREQLMITLSGEAILLGGLRTAESSAFSLNDHEQAWGDLIG